MKMKGRRVLCVPSPRSSATMSSIGGIREITLSPCSRSIELTTPATRGFSREPSLITAGRVKFWGDWDLYRRVSRIRGRGFPGLQAFPYKEAHPSNGYKCVATLLLPAFDQCE